MKYVIALDAGTTSIRAYLYDTEAEKFIYSASQEVELSYPHPGWVEQNANEIYFKAAYCLNECARAAGGKIAGIGIANQRETVVLWDAESGEPVCPAIVWQCRRTSDFCASIPEAERARIAEKTGLLPDAYFSASKIKWCLEHVPAAQKLLRAGKLRAGTVDSYLIARLTEGQSFVTDHTNASRTMLFGIGSLAWERELLDYFGIPQEILPRPLPCDGIFGATELGGARVPIAGVAGDQQAALIGQGALGEGDAKITYGTGLFLLFSTGTAPIRSKGGLLTTVACTLGGETRYALEGSVFNAGSSVQWLRDGLGFLTSSAESEPIARSVADTGGVYFVPAFTGLGAPHWDAEARGLLTGITRGTGKAHIVRAVLESIAYSARELIDCMTEESGMCLRSIKCDGGASANDFLMQFQADVLGISVRRPREKESTALGAALLCAYALGMIGREELFCGRAPEKVFSPSPDRAPYEALYRGYRDAVKRALLRP